MTRARDIADQQDNLGGAVAPFVAGKNFVLNGGMDIWQRGTTKLDGANGYHTADRWLLSSAPAITFSRQTTSDTTNLPFIQYCMRLQRTAGSTNTNNANISQSFESVNSVPLAGKTVTLSFYARKGANYSATNSDISVQLFTGTGTDQNIYLVGYTGSIAAINSTAVLTTTWQRFTYTATLAANTNEIGLIFVGTQTGTAGAADYYEITGIQLEQGSAATPFARAGGSIGGELALCQRYYFRTPTGSAQASAYMRHGSGAAFESVRAGIQVQMPVPLRVLPSSVDFANLALNRDVSVAHIPVTAVALEAAVNGSLVCNIYCTVASGLTTGVRYELENNGNSAGYVGFNAEL